MGTNLGENIRKARKALKLSQDALGELTGANRVTISKYENNEYNPSLPALKRLAEALHTTPAELTGDEPDTKKEPAQPGGMRESVMRLFDEIEAAGLSDAEAEYIRSQIEGIKALRKPG